MIRVYRQWKFIPDDGGEKDFDIFNILQAIEEAALELDEVEQILDLEPGVGSVRFENRQCTVERLS